MAHRIKSINIKTNYVIEALFFGGELKQYDIKGLFKILPDFQIFEKNPELFKSVSVDKGGYGISWTEELDLDAETIWEDGILIEVRKKPDFSHLLAHRLLMAREKANMTQKELAEKTGIYQADISKLERGLGNPSIATLERLADGLEMDLQIDFIIRK